MNQIICIGNRLVPEDAAALLVYDYLCAGVLPDGVEVVEGGLAGIDLLPRLEQGGRIVFVDTVAGFTQKGQMVVLDRETILAQTPEPRFGHNAGIGYLLALLPHVCEGTPPEMIHLVGLEGPCEKERIYQAARLCLDLVTRPISK